MIRSKRGAIILNQANVGRTLIAVLKFLTSHVATHARFKHVDGIVKGVHTSCKLSYIADYYQQQHYMVDLGAKGS